MQFQSLWLKNQNTINQAFNIKNNFNTFVKSSSNEKIYHEKLFI